MAFPLIMAGLKVLILAGGGQAADNHDSHRVHVESLQQLLVARGVPTNDITVFWADGIKPGVDRAVMQIPPSDDDWIVRFSSMHADTAVLPELKDTQFEGITVKEARRANLAAHLAELGPTLSADDTVLLAVTDHGEPDPTGGLNSRIVLWGETWSVDELAADLAPIPAETRIVLWMSQCYSGGFADIARRRPNLCGAFSATADRPAYGCHPELAGRTDIGHFRRMLDGLETAESLAAANEHVLLTDDTPDTPHLTSDAFLFAALDRQARAQHTDPVRYINHLMNADPTDPAMRLAAQISARFGLGAPADYGAVADVLDRVASDRYSLGIWTQAFEAALMQAIDADADGIISTVGQPEGREQHAQKRDFAESRLRRQIGKHKGLRARLIRLHQRIEHLYKLAEQLDQQEAAAVRVAYLYARMAVEKGLSTPEQATLEQLRACEARPLLPSLASKKWVSKRPTALPPVWTLNGEIERTSPGFFGINFRNRPNFKGVRIQGFAPGGPGAASGLKIGDDVIAVDGWRLRRRGGFQTAAFLSTPGTNSVFTVRRKRKTLKIQVPISPTPLPPRPPRVGDMIGEVPVIPYQGTLPPIAAGRGVVLYFWTTRCKPCKKSTPALVEWAKIQKLDVIAVTDDSRRVITRFLKRTEFPFPIALDSTGKASRLFRIEQTPTFVHIDPQAMFIDRAEGFTGVIPLQGAPR